MSGKEARAELMAILNFPHEVSTLLPPPPRTETRARARARALPLPHTHIKHIYTFVYIYMVGSIFMCRFDGEHSLEALVCSVRQREGIG